MGLGARSGRLEAKLAAKNGVRRCGLSEIESGLDRIVCEDSSPLNDS
jgi:hypothetical protein